jgi:integrase/recombinase XerD
MNKVNREAREGALGHTLTTDLARVLQTFFYQRLIQQRNASDRTVASYRDTFRLLLCFAEQRLGKQVNELCLDDIDTTLVLGFLDYLERQRHNCIRTRNARLAAIRALLHYAALQEPAALPQIQRVMAIPMKRFDRAVVGFLSREEIEAILSALDTATWSGQRDAILLTVLYNTGARVSEIIAIKYSDVIDSRCSAVLLHGKGRKERVVPLWKRTSALLRHWMEQSDATAQQSLFPNRFGQPMTRSGVASRLKVAVKRACPRCPSLCNKVISPHVIRHSTAMHLLQSGVDLAVIALWLGHESIVTTHHYLQADLEMKKQALAALQPPDMAVMRFKPSTDVLAFLDGL